MSDVASFFSEWFSIKASVFLGILGSVSFWLLLVSPLLTLLHSGVRSSVDKLRREKDNAGLKDHDFLSNYYMHAFVLLSAVIVATHSLVPEIIGLEEDVFLSPFFISAVLTVGAGWAVSFAYLAHTDKLVGLYHDFEFHHQPLRIIPCWQAQLRVLVLWAFVIVDVIRVV